MVAGMSDKWRDRARDLQRLQSAREIVEYTELRLAMGEIWAMLNDVPEAIKKAYRNLSDEEIRALELVYRDLLDEGHMAWSISGNDRTDALSIGAQLRALDSALSDRPGFKVAPTSPQSLYCAEVEAFIIPRGVPKPVDRRPGPGNGFGRRATPHHRILPRVLKNGLEVKPIWSPHLSFGLSLGHEQTVGAALMPTMKVEFEKQANGTYRAIRAPCADEANILAEQIKGAYGGPILAVAWPELSMPPDRLELLKADMRERSLLVDAQQGPAITVAGSWHDERGGFIRNVMRVLDKSGSERLLFDKVTTFVGGGITEANMPGEIIPVLMNNDALVTFAVCSDFCDLEIDPPYLSLDIDLLVVPSLGTGAALNGHEGNAKRLGILFGTSTFLVQQNEDTHVPVGWVIPTCMVSGKLEEDKAWSVRQITFT